MSGVRGVQGRTFRGGVTAALAGCLLLAGCTGGSTTAPSSTSVTSTAVSPSPSASVAAEPTIPAAAQVGTRDGAKAFFTYFWDVYNFSFANLDTDRLKALSSPTCKFCNQGLKNVGDARVASRRFSGGLVSLDVVVVAPIDKDGGTVVNCVLTQAKGELIAADGSVVRTYPQQKQIRVDAGVRWENSRWTMVEVVIGPGANSTP